MPRGIYRKAHGSNTWHFCTNCPLWPAASYLIHIGGTPAEGELCTQCLANDQNQECL